MTGIASSPAVFQSGKAIRVEHRRSADSWFWRDEETREYLLRRGDDTEVHTVDRDTVERTANHRDNEYELVPVEQSPFGG